MESILTKPPSFTNKELMALRPRMTYQRSHSQGRGKSIAQAAPFHLQCPSDFPAWLLSLVHPEPLIPPALVPEKRAMALGSPSPVPFSRAPSEPAALFRSPFPLPCVAVPTGRRHGASGCLRSAPAEPLACWLPRHTTCSLQRRSPTSSLAHAWYSINGLH